MGRLCSALSERIRRKRQQKGRKSRLHGGMGGGFCTLQPSCNGGLGNKEVTNATPALAMLQLGAPGKGVEQGPQGQGDNHSFRKGVPCTFHLPQKLVVSQSEGSIGYLIARGSLLSPAPSPGHRCFDMS